MKTLRELLIEFAEAGYWYAEDTGDYEMKEFIDHNDEAREIMEQIQELIDDKRSPKD